MSDGADIAQAPHRAVWPRTLAIGVAAVLVCACGAASIGQPGPIAGSASVLYLVLTQGMLAGVYLLGAFGLGLAIVRLIPPAIAHKGAAAAGFGLAAMLSITHLLGITGGLSNRLVALVPVAIGVAIVARSLPLILASIRTAERPSLLWLAGVPAAGVLLAAACNPPGWLWSSEFGGYDSLVYHLQLPREWYAMGVITPLEHNVYSYLPSYVESAFVHLAAISGADRNEFVTDDGGLLIACKLLHASMTLVAGWCAAGAARSILQGMLDDTRSAGAIAGVLVIATPWSVVTGSMAYNEMAMLALLFAAVHAAVSTDLSGWKRGMLAGALVGAACGCKPTALVLGAPIVGLLMLATVPRRAVVGAVAAGCVAGVVMLAPWLVRNALAGGNPVFPMLTSVFGSAHWSAEQVDRYARAHTFDGGLLDALRLLVVPDAADPAARESRPIHRGMLHPQWAFAGPVLVVSLLIAAAFRSTRLLALALATGVVIQILVWATMTHVQSRFLIPLLLPTALAAALGGSAVLAWATRGGGPRRGVLLSSAAVLVATSAMTLGIYAGEYRGPFGPNHIIGFGSSYFTNYRVHAEDPALAPPDPYLRAMLPDGAVVLCIGDAKALYKPEGALYATTYDESPLAKALRAFPDDPRSALRSLEATHIYIDWIELRRLWRTGWAAPALDPGQLQRLLLAHALIEHEFLYDGPGGERFVAQELYRLPERTP
ncbi:MAG: hypothetical protein AAFN41_01185 [Planctomycetota bacterium]